MKSFDQTAGVAEYVVPADEGYNFRWHRGRGNKQVRVLCKRASKKATGDCLARSRGSAGCALAEEEIQES